MLNIRIKQVSKFQKKTQKSKYLIKEDLILNMSVSGCSINRCNVIVINKYHIHHLIKEGEVVVVIILDL